jgi:catechol 2,3-dioxygenase-like lactoylglutathione lyase family enzyme
MGVTLRCEIFPSDLDRTLRFYVDVLSFDVVRDERRADPPYVAMRRADVHVGAAARPPIPNAADRRPPTGVELVLEVDDVDTEHDRIRATGWPITEDPALRSWGLRDFRLLDPDGYYWRITERAPRHDPA